METQLLWTAGVRPTTILCWPILCSPFGYSHLSLSRYTTGRTTSGRALYLVSLWGLVEVLVRILWMPSHLLYESAMIKDQVCPNSNKERCLLTHPFFVIYKPDPLAHTALIRPPPSRRISTSSFVQLHPNKQGMRVAAPAHPLVALIGCVQFELLFTLLSLQTTFERVIG